MDTKLPITVAAFGLMALSFGGSSSSTTAPPPVRGPVMPPPPPMLEVMRVLDGGRKVQALLNPAMVTVLFNEYRDQCPGGCARIQIDNASFTDHWWVATPAAELAGLVSMQFPVIEVSMSDDQGRAFAIYVAVNHLESFGPSPVRTTSRRPKAKLVLKNGMKLLLMDTLASVQEKLSGRVPEVR